MKIIFLDRDGVINKDPGGWTEHDYVTEWKDFHFIPGALEALRLLYINKYNVILISNQAGVNKGYFSKEDLDKVTSKMLGEVKKAGGDIEDVYYCMHRDEDNCNCRKPKTGLLDMAARKYGINFRDTFFIGDSRVDVMAGKMARCQTVFVLSGKAALKDVKEWPVKPDHVFKNLLEAVQWLLARGRRKEDRAFKRKIEKKKGRS